MYDKYVNVDAEKLLYDIKLKYNRQISDGFNQKGTSELEEDVKVLSKKIKKLEIKVVTHDSKIEELDFRTNLIPFTDNIDDILEYLQTELSEIKYIQNVSYVPVDGSTIEIIIVHSLEDRVTALQSIRKKVLNVRIAFPDIHFNPILLHTSEVQSDHTHGTKQIFQK